ncbi:DUF5709 domain-containing protein [Streptomyces sp. TRM76323]|uniref:DUF5709 domain-containing protein n=1 Tax=Streptomyces tamarix TaxID=3078565 RepID=A0ABU3QRH5_9ACTN|nr:DUF5709 domain-containing protein [Streptomyces tamarix]MDT9685381.1 DUF5709 domain-containing protein [Streptomyces tamarix]
MGTEETMGDEVYQPDPTDDREILEDHGILDDEDTLSDRATNPYEEGYSPPERPLAADDVGTTAREQREGESLDRRLSREVPDPALRTDDAEAASDGIGDLPGGMGEPYDDQVGQDRSGRLVAPDEGAHTDTEKDVVGRDVGIDGGAASAEEAAVHLIPEPSEEGEGDRGYVGDTGIGGDTGDERSG